MSPAPKAGGGHDGGEPIADRLVNARIIESIAEDDQEPIYRATRYTVYPSGFSRVAAAERRNWCVHVEDAGDGWAVRWRSRCLNYRYVWEFEPPKKSRTGDFLRRCRFSERAALLRAKQAVDQLQVDGMTYEEFVAHVRERAAEEARAALATGASATPLDPPGQDPVLPLHLRLTRARRRQRPSLQ